MTGLSWTIPHPLVWILIIMLLAATAWTLRMVWLRLFGTSRLRWFWVSGLNIIAAVCVGLLLVPPSFPSPNTGEVVLLTQGADVASLSVGDDVLIAPGGPDSNRPGSEYLSQIDQMLLRRPELHSLTVLGHGLDAEQWSRLPEHLEIKFEPPLISGPVDLLWPQMLKTGELLTVSGRWMAGGVSEVAQVRLLDPAGLTVDTTSVRDPQRFLLQAMPVAAGNSIYSLEFDVDGESQVISLPVFVQRSAAPSLLIVQSSPSFETRQLSNWAADRDSQILVLTQISQDRYITQSYNRTDSTDVRFSPETLGNSDFLMMDGRAFVNLDESQRTWLEDAVRDGLGVLLLADESLAGYLENNPRDLLAGFSLVRDPDAPEDTLVQVPGLTTDTLLGVFGYALGAQRGSPLFRDDNGRLMSAFKSLGFGRIAMSVARERHRWLTHGETDIYSAYWAGLMAQLARPRTGPYFLPPGAGEWHTVGSRSWVCASGQSSEIVFSIKEPVDQPGQDEQIRTLQPVSDTRGSNRHCAAWWPQSGGWHQLNLETGDGSVTDRLSIWVHSANELTSARQFRRQLATRARAEIASQNSSIEESVSVKPLHPFWPLILFLLSSSILWLERRL